MTEHTYPADMPRLDPRTSVRVAWDILDGVRPGRLPPILRFYLARHISNAVAGINEVQRVAAAAIELRDFFVGMPPQVVHHIAILSPELVQHLGRLAFRVPANENEDKESPTS